MKKNENENSSEKIKKGSAGWQHQSMIFTKI
jgi:hypothetical protein